MIDANMSGLDIMISLLGLIITLSIAYNFYNIWRSDNRIKKIEKAIDTFKEQINEKVDDLAHQITKNKLSAELIRMDSNVSNNYRTNNWIEGLKHEYEILAFLCQNFEYFQDDFQGKIGMKRSSVSSILLNIHDTFDATTIANYSHDTIRDCFRTVRRMWDSSYYSTSYANVKTFEGDIFEELSVIAETLFKQIENMDFPLHLPGGTIQKLKEYKTKFGN